MLISLNGEKTKGFFLDKEKNLKIPMDFVFNRAIPKEERILFAAFVKHELLNQRKGINDDELANILEKLEFKMNQDLLILLDWLQKRKYIVIQGF